MPSHGKYQGDDDDVNIGAGRPQGLLNVKKSRCPTKKIAAMRAHLAHKGVSHLLGEDYCTI